MRANVALGYFVLALACALIAAATAEVMSFNSTPPHRGPLYGLGPCRKIVGGPTREYVCATGHVYALQAGEVIDLGVVTPASTLPRR